MQPGDAIASVMPLRSGDSTQTDEAARQRELHKLRRATGDFEALFLAKMLKSMQQTVGREKSEFDSGGDVMREVGWEKVAESLAQKQGLGLGDLLYDALETRVTRDTTKLSQPPDSATAPKVMNLTTTKADNMITDKGTTSIPLGPETRRERID